MAENIWSLLGMLFTVATVLALACWCARLAGRFGSAGFGWSGGPGTGSGGRGGGELRVLSLMSLGRGQRLLLLGLGKRCLLLGVTNERIAVLAELSEEEAEIWLRKSQPNGRSNASNPGFLEALRDCMAKKK